MPLLCDAPNGLKFRIGGHAVRAGIHTWDDAQILGMMIRCKEMADNDPKLLSDWQTIGGKLINDGRETRDRGAQGSGVEILVRFPAKPDDDRVMKALRGYGLRWDAHGTSWTGSVAPGDVAAIERFVADHGGVSEIPEMTRSSQAGAPHPGGRATRTPGDGRLY